MDGEAVKPADPRKSLTPSSYNGLRSEFFRSGTRWFSGFVVDPDDPGRKFVVEIMVDGYPIRLVRADAYVPQLAKEKIGDGHNGFSCALDHAVVNDSSFVEARVANLGMVIGIPVTLAKPCDTPPNLSASVALRWLGGLRFSGWIAGREDFSTENVLVDGMLIMRVRPSIWRHVGTSETDARAVRAFDFHLPNRFADGRVHQMILGDSAGESISGNPLVFVAYADGLSEAIAIRGFSDQEGLRGELFDRLLPMSVPFSDYQGWRERFPIWSGPSMPLRCAVIMIGPGQEIDTLESLNEQTHSNWVAASLPQIEDPLGMHAEFAKEFLTGDGEDCDFVIFALAGTVFAPAALQRFAAAFAEISDAQVVYADVDLQSNDGSVWPLAFPAFDYERMLEQGYCSHLFALRRAVAERSLDMEVSNLYRVFNSVLDDGAITRNNIVHLPGPIGTLPDLDNNAATLALAAATTGHLQRRGILAQVKPGAGGVLPAVRVMRKPERVRTTIIIPTRNRLDLLRSCIESIGPAVARAQAEILVVDNDTSNPDTLDYLHRD